MARVRLATERIHVLGITGRASTAARQGGSSAQEQAKDDESADQHYRPGAHHRVFKQCQRTAWLRSGQRAARQATERTPARAGDERQPRATVRRSCTSLPTSNRGRVVAAPARTREDENDTVKAEP